MQTIVCARARASESSIVTFEEAVNELQRPVVAVALHLIGLADQSCLGCDGVQSYCVSGWKVVMLCNAGEEIDEARSGFLHKDHS